MDFTEAALELLVQKVNGIIQTKLQTMTPKEIAMIGKEIPKIPTMLEYRSIRDDFLNRFNNPEQLPPPKPFAEALLSQSTEDFDITENTKTSLSKYFEKELKRTKSIRDIVMERTSKTDNDPYVLTTFLDSISKHLYDCQSSLQTLSVVTNQSITQDALILELTGKFINRRRSTFLKTLERMISDIPNMNSQEIYKDIFESIQKSMVRDSSKDPIPILPRTEAEVDTELLRLAEIMGIPADVESSDGQQFLYHANRVFDETFKTELPQITETSKIPKIEPRYEDLIQKALLDECKEDFKISAIFNNLLHQEHLEASTKIQDQANIYNIVVGNQIKGKTYTAEQRRKFIPQHKLVAWFELRFCHSRNMLFSLLNTLDFFENIRIPHTTGVSQMAYDQLLNIINGLMRIGSFYADRFETNVSERNVLVVDRDTIVEQLLMLEIQYNEAKRKLIEALLDVYDHVKTDSIKTLMSQIIDERPFLNLENYKNYEEPYLINIELYRIKAKAIRFIVNAQILHERSVAKEFESELPLFDNPTQFNSPLFRNFNESVPQNQFEVYFSLARIERIFISMDSVAKQLSEAADFKYTRYMNYIHRSLWANFDHLLMEIPHFGLFPANRATFEFTTEVSQPVLSLFFSPYVNDIRQLKSLLEEMNEGRQVRFLLQLRRFTRMTWHLQTDVLVTHFLEQNYLRQCDALGITEKAVLMKPFKDSFRNEIIDLNPFIEMKTFQFALNEFEEVNIDFSSYIQIKDLVALDFVPLKKLIKFQRLQNTILQIAVSYNSHILNSDFFVNYFGLNSNEITFLTNYHEDDEGVEKQWIAASIFNHSNEIFRDNQIARQNKGDFELVINSIKSRSRTILSAHTKQKSMSDEEMLDLYIEEMIDTFSPFIYRTEIAVILRLERQIIDSNTFVDTYLIGDHLINEAGRLESFFALPTWTEVFLVLKSAPHSRQGTVLKGVLEYLISRLSILSILKFESTLSQRSTQAFITTFKQIYSFETPELQKLKSDLDTLPNSCEVEIATKFVNNKRKFYFMRLEYAILTTLEKCFTVSTESKEANIYALNQDFFDTIKGFWLQLHTPLYDGTTKCFSGRYLPDFLMKSYSSLTETNRAQFATTLLAIDTEIEHAVTLGQTIDSTPQKIDFLSISIALIHLRFAYFLLQKDGNEKLSVRDSVTQISRDVYLEGSTGWREVVEAKAVKHLVPKDDNPSRFSPEVPDIKHLQSVFDVARSQIDLLLLSNQIRYLESEKKLLSQDFSLPPSNDPFMQEFIEARKKLVELAFYEIDNCTLERRNHDNTFTTLYDGDLFENHAYSFSFLLSRFGEKSREQTINKWFQQLHDLEKEYKMNGDLVQSGLDAKDFVLARFERQTEMEISLNLHDNFLTLNQCLNKMKKSEQEIEEFDIQVNQQVEQEYKRLCDDLNDQITQVKGQFSQVKRSVYDEVLKRVNKAKATPIATDLGEIQPVSQLDNDLNQLTELTEENKHLKNSIIFMRVMRCLGTISVTRFYRKRIISMEGDRRFENATLWDRKLKEEKMIREKEQQVEEKHKNLSQMQLEIERLKQQLENEKMNNIQLVHWKAKNLKKVEELQEQIRKFDGIGSVDIKELRDKVEKAHSELDQLIEETKEIEERAIEEIKKPMEEIQKLREMAKQAKIEKSSVLDATIRSLPTSEEVDMKEGFVQQLSEENIQLKHENQLLKERIQELENAKSMKSEHAISVMEGNTRAKSVLKVGSNRSIVRPFPNKRSASRL